MVEHLPLRRLLEACPGCGRDCIPPLIAVEHHQQVLRYAMCTHCGFVFMNPCATERDLDEFYAHAYRGLYDGSEQPTADQLRLQTDRALVYAEMLALARTSYASHLDLGCSAGLLLDACARRFGIAVSRGVEPGVGYRNTLAERGIECFADLGAAIARGDRYELVSLAHVLEHVARPIELLATITRELLAPDGLVMIEVPNFDDAWSFEIAHAVCFSPKTLANTLAAAGLEPVVWRLHGRPRTDSASDRRYIFTVARRSATGPTNPAAAPAIGGWYRWTIALRMWHSITRDSWPMFFAKLPVRWLKHGGFPWRR